MTLQFTILVRNPNLIKSQLEVLPALAYLQGDCTLARRFCSCQRNLALGKEILLLTIEMKIGTPPRFRCSCQRDMALGKEILLLPKKPCSWQGDFALGKESETLTPPIYFTLPPTKVSLTLPKRFLPWQGDFALAKEIFTLARRFCS